MPRKTLWSITLALSCFVLLYAPSQCLTPHLTTASYRLIAVVIFSSICLSILAGLLAFFFGTAASREILLRRTDKKWIIPTGAGQTLGLFGCIIAIVFALWWPEPIENGIRDKISHEQNSLRSIAGALDAYIAYGWEHCPPNLDFLTRKQTFNPPLPFPGNSTVSEMAPFIDAIPPSMFNQSPPRYYTIPNMAWMAWYPGPNKVFDITIEPQNKDIQMWLGHGGAMPSWLFNNLYDPTNGILSKGDMIRWNGGVGAETWNPPSAMK